MATVDLYLHPKQTIAFESEATEILYGGAAGPGKSHFLRVAGIAWCVAIPGLQVYLFRRLHDDLVKNHMEGPTGFHSLLAEWVKAGIVQIVDDEVRFNNGTNGFKDGSKIFLCHCQHEKDRFKYQGPEIHVLLVDELTHFTDVIYRFLRGRTRIPKGSPLKIPDRYKGQFPRIVCASNPGGIGHQWVKSTFIDPKPAMEIWETSESEGGKFRQFIPAVLTDNPSLDQVEYRKTLMGLGNEALVEAMLNGNWDIVAGAALDVDRHKHMIRPFKPPSHWTKFMSMDWGFVKPFSVGWYCVVEGGTLLRGQGKHEDKYLPHGALIRYREWYGSEGKPDEGMRLESPYVAQKIMEMEDEAGETMDYRVADTQLWAKNDGPSMMDRMFKATGGKFNPRQSIKDRQANYSEVCLRLKGEEQDDKTFLPMFYVTENCTHWWRTVPSLVLDDLHPERGPDEKQELHAYDDTQYACASWPYVTTNAQRVKHEFFSRKRKHDPEPADPYRLRKKFK